MAASVSTASRTGAIESLRRSSSPLGLAIYGPTAIGKTALAMALVDSVASELPIRLISVDSALVYRGMDIGTGKPSAAQLRRYPHELIDVIDPAERYSVAQFIESAASLFSAATQAGELPVFVGGTMLYFKALRDGLAELPAADAELRMQLQQRLQQQGAQTLHDELARKDPETAAQIAPTNTQRLLRALEVLTLSGQGLAQYWRAQHEREASGPIEALGGRLLEFGLAPASRTALHERISERFDLMLAEGLVDEVRALRARGDLSLELPSMRSVGYRQIWQHLDGQAALTQACDAAKTATRKLAKRQLTWMRGWQSLPRVSVLECGSAPTDLLEPLLHSCKIQGLQP